MTVFYILLSSTSPRAWQMAAQGKDMKFSYKHLIPEAEAFKEKCWVSRPGLSRGAHPDTGTAQKMVHQTRVRLAVFSGH